MARQIKTFQTLHPFRYGTRLGTRSGTWLGTW